MERLIRIYNCNQTASYREESLKVKKYVNNWANSKWNVSLHK